MYRNEDIFDKAYRFLVEKTLEHYGAKAVGLKIVHTDERESDGKAEKKEVIA